MLVRGPNHQKCTTNVDFNALVRYIRVNRLQTSDDVANYHVYSNEEM